MPGLQRSRHRTVAEKLFVCRRPHVNAGLKEILRDAQLQFPITGEPSFSGFSTQRFFELREGFNTNRAG
jgi:hypothetical protein